VRSARRHAPRNRIKSSFCCGDNFSAAFSISVSELDVKWCFNSVDASMALGL
jgi:hypothetical protein